MAKFTDEELAKMPKWIRNRINALERDVETYREMFAQMGVGETPVILDVVGNIVHLPEIARIVFRFPNGEIQVHMDEDGIEVHGTGNHRTKMAVLPRYSNSAFVKFFSEE